MSASRNRGVGGIERRARCVPRRGRRVAAREARRAGRAAGAPSRGRDGLRPHPVVVLVGSELGRRATGLPVRPGRPARFRRRASVARRAADPQRRESSLHLQHADPSRRLRRVLVASRSRSGLSSRTRPSLQRFSWTSACSCPDAAGTAIGSTRRVPVRSGFAPGSYTRSISIRPVRLFSAGSTDTSESRRGRRRTSRLLAAELEPYRFPTAPSVVEWVEVRADPKLAGASLDFPQSGTRAAGRRIHVLGWAMGDRARVRAAELWSGEQLIGSAPVDKPRPDLVAAFPDRKEAQAAGFRTSVSLVGMSPLEVSSSPSSRTVPAPRSVASAQLDVSVQKTPISGTRSFPSLSWPRTAAISRKRWGA